MARNLVKAGHRVTVFDIVPTLVEACVAAGATAAESAAAPGLVVVTAKDCPRLTLLTTVADAPTAAMTSPLPWMRVRLFEVGVPRETAPAVTSVSRRISPASAQM